jgi:hypothetical protein
VDLNEKITVFEAFKQWLGEDQVPTFSKFHVEVAHTCKVQSKNVGIGNKLLMYKGCIFHPH